MAFSPGSQSASELSQMAETLDGAFIAPLCDAAKQARLFVLAAIYETCQVKERVYDTAVWIGSDGKVASSYRKLHLYDAFGFKESDKFHPGAELGAQLKIAAANIGTMICYDLRFPEMARMLALQGANVLVAPSGWVQGDLKVEHWQTMIKARALENGCFVVAPNQVGNIYTGHSMAVDPLGRTLAELGDSEGLAVVEADLALVDEVREKLPLLKNRRDDVYQKYLSRR
ncbi:MAG: amidohydrolase [Deltaproteobacteria bacterium]|nr:amidohydrolase [Deltaproteobacteria bacterium]